jgi:hypothetical protein
MKTIYINSNLVPMWHPNWPQRPPSHIDFGKPGEFERHFELGGDFGYEKSLAKAKKEAVPFDNDHEPTVLFLNHSEFAANGYKEIKPGSFIQVEIGEVELYVHNLGVVTLSKQQHGTDTVWVEWDGGRTNVPKDSIFARIVPKDNGAMSYTEGMETQVTDITMVRPEYPLNRKEWNGVDFTDPHSYEDKLRRDLVEAQKRIAELEEWKRQELELTQPIIGYCQNDENAKRLGIAIGSSIFKRVLEILKEYNGSNNRIKELEDLIQSDSVYTLLRFGSKSPSGSGMDDCEDDSYIDLYNISKELRTIDATKTGNHG